MKIQVNDVNLYYEKIGSGHPLIMLHGNSQSMKIFNKMAVSLKDYFEIYLIDSRNHGKSDESDRFSYYIMAEDVKEFIKKMNLKDPYVIGFSDGAITSVLTEIKYPHTFSRMALMGLNMTPHDMKDEVYEETKELYEFLELEIIKVMLMEPDIKIEELENIDAKILFIYGEDDLFKEDLYEKIQGISNSRLIKVKGHDHGSYLKDSEAVFDDLIEFFR